MGDVHRVDRAVGAVLGAALGDALGAPFEFGSPKPHDHPVDLSGGGSFGWKPGEWTDDTQMATAILSVAATGSDDVDQIAAGFLTWFASHPADVGNQTRAVLSDAASASDLADAATRYQADSPDGAGNGSLMRTSPVALFHPDDRDATARLAADISALTHPHPDCVAACVLWTEAIRRQITSTDAGPPGDWHELISDGLDLVDEASRGRWRELVDSTRLADPATFAPKNGWVVDAFRQALATIATTPVPEGWRSPEHPLAAIEAACRGGYDTDTVAAIIGGLVGATWGALALPLHHTTRLNGLGVAPKATNRITVTDLDQSARRAVAGGEPDGQGWPGIERLVPYYRHELLPPSRLIEVAPGLRFGTVADLDAVLTGSDPVTVISLCRMGADDVEPPHRIVPVGLVDASDAHPHLPHALFNVADLIQARRAAGEAVFVHCVRAETRTPSAYAAWRALHDGATIDLALDEAERLFGGPTNESFVAALREFDD